MIKKYPTLHQSLSNAQSVYFLGVGSELRRDDAAGWEFIKYLESHLIGKKSNLQLKKKLKLGYGAAAPENFAGEIANFAPDLLVVFDAVFYPEKEPGEIVIVDQEMIGGVTFNTHSLPLKIILDFILKAHPCVIMVLGIVPIDTQFGQGLTPIIKRRTRKLAKDLVPYFI